MRSGGATYKKRTESIVKRCIFCSKYFKTYIKYIEKGNGKFCSHKCFGVWTKEHAKEINRSHKRINLSCLYCSKNYLDYPSRIERKFCSKDCFSKYQIGKLRKSSKVKYICEACKKEFFEYAYRKAKFCSVDCLWRHKVAENSIAWKGGCPKCKICKKTIEYGAIYCQKHKHLLWTKEHWLAMREGSRSLKRVGIMPMNMTRKGKYGNVVRGIFNINGKNIFFRSKWEANYALYLDFLVNHNQISKWEYEVDVFIFEKIKFGTRSYRPDFKIFNKDGSTEYHEIKGWMDKKSKTKINRMRIYYPQIKLRVIEGTEYRALLKQFSSILKLY